MRKNWKIDTQDIKFDYSWEEERFRQEKTIKLALQTIDEIIEDNSEGELGELAKFYIALIEELVKRVQSHLEGMMMLQKGGRK